MIDSAGMYMIPPGTQPSACSSCGQQIFWVEHTRKPRNKADKPSPKPLPISIKHDMALEPTRTTWGRGISHVADCPFAARHVKSYRNGPPKLELVS